MTSSSPNSSLSAGSPYDATLAGLANVSAAVTGSGSVSGTVAVTAGHYLVLRYAKDDGGDAGANSITAELSIS